MLALEVGEADEGPVGHHHAMNCPRCSGLLVPETVHDVALSEDLLRCVNCGRMAKEGEILEQGDLAFVRYVHVDGPLPDIPRHDLIALLKHRQGMEGQS